MQYQKDLPYQTDRYIGPERKCASIRIAAAKAKTAAAKTSEMEARSDYDRNEQRPEILRLYASNFLYNAAGAVTAMRLGNGRWTGLDIAWVSCRFDAPRERASPGKMSFKLYVTTSLMITLQEKQ